VAGLVGGLVGVAGASGHGAYWSGTEAAFHWPTAWPATSEGKKKGMKPLPASIAFEKLKKLDGKNFALGTLKEYASDFGPDHKKYN